MLRRTAALATAGALALGGVALLVPSTASATQESVAAQAERGKLLKPAERRELRQSGHATVTRETKKHGTVTVQVQRGVVTGVSPTSITVKSKDGYEHSYALTGKTKVRSNKATVAAASDLKVGAKAQVIAVKDEARRIRFLKLPGA